jgi:hypothetical protein
VFCGTIVFAYGDFADKCHFMFDFFDLNRGMRCFMTEMLNFPAEIFYIFCCTIFCRWSIVN